MGDGNEREYGKLYPAARAVLFIVQEPGSRTPRVLGFPDHRESSGKNP